MVRKALSGIVPIFFGLIILSGASAGSDSMQGKTAARASLKVDRLEVVLPVTFHTRKARTIRVTVDLLSPKGEECGRRTEDRSLQPDDSAIEMELPLVDCRRMLDNLSDLSWYRLRYRVDNLSGREQSWPEAESILPLGHILTNLLGVRLLAPEDYRPGEPLRGSVLTFHPLTDAPLDGVRWEASLTAFEADGDRLLATTGETGKLGLSEVVFQIPQDFHGENLYWNVEAHLEGQTVRVSYEVDLNIESVLWLHTDKPLYQPGQTVHVRAQAMVPGKTVLPDQLITFRIEDPAGGLAFRETAVTSRYGIATAEWTLPDAIGQGQFSIEAEAEDSSGQSYESYRSIQVRRYELPQFTVSVKSDRSYYLPGQDAQVEVRADYLFGKPVTAGKVRVVQEEDRDWNYREQRWDIDEGEIYEAELDTQGTAQVQVSLTELHEEIEDDDYSPYQDARFTAYVTDAGTGRTEQRRFELRATSEEIHIHTSNYNRIYHREFPIPFHIVTSYADGAPAACTVTIRTLDSEDSEPGEVLAVFRTNRFGVARVDEFVPPAEVSDEPWSEYVHITAEDEGGKIGTSRRGFDEKDEPFVVIRTGKTIHRPGEPIQAEFAGMAEDDRIVLAVFADSDLLSLQIVELTDGRARLSIPYRDGFRGEIQLRAYSTQPTTGDWDSGLLGYRSVLFPLPGETRVKAELDRDEYAPGDSGKLRLQFISGDAPASGALGVVIYDQAVEERARTDDLYTESFGFDRQARNWRWHEPSIAGVNLEKILELDLESGVPSDLDVLSEALIDTGWIDDRLGSRVAAPGRNAVRPTLFQHVTEPAMKQVREVVDRHYASTQDYPESRVELEGILRPAGVDLDSYRDPWGSFYHTSFEAEDDHIYMKIYSPGPDKQADTEDDFVTQSRQWKYFDPVGTKMTNVVNRYHEKTAGYLADLPSLENQMAAVGIDLASLRDPWGTPYRFDFEVVENLHRIRVRSNGPDRKPAEGNWREDDVELWVAQVDYFIRQRVMLRIALENQRSKGRDFPSSEEEYRAMLRDEGIDSKDLRDPWRNDYYPKFRKSARYMDMVELESKSKDEKSSLRRKRTPVTQELLHVDIWSAGRDGKRDTDDDFRLERYTQVVAVLTTDGGYIDSSGNPILDASRGAIAGTVTDPDGFAIPGAEVTVRHPDGDVWETFTDRAGRYVILDLPPGNRYVVEAHSEGFRTAFVTEIPVRAGTMTTVDFQLEVGAIMETVTVAAGSPEYMNTTNSVLATDVAALPLQRGRGLEPKSRILPNFTPRIRQEFKETLLWVPEVETDSQGRAEVDFRMADNITTWKISVIGSTTDARVATATLDALSFQPFFVENDPPKFLTAGDEIHLPVVVRNYLDESQEVRLSTGSDGWMSPVGPGEKTVRVAGGGTVTSVFPFRAEHMIEEGHHSVSAIGTRRSDAIERTVQVRPDGQMMFRPYGTVFRDTSTIEFDIPGDAMRDTPRADLKIYPNLAAHLAESIEGLVERPYGCAEQTISAAFGSLLYLDLLGDADPDGDPLAQKALVYLRLGVERLRRYQQQHGGISYWASGEANAEVTAYGLEFLAAASRYVEIPDEEIDANLRWLLQRQESDGRWPWRHWSRMEDRAGTLQLTAWVARVLAELEPSRGSEQLRSGLEHARRFVRTGIEETDDPYLLAAYLLSFPEPSAAEDRMAIANRLRTLAHREGPAVYWHLKSNTPFYAWGLAGRIETTAVALRALARHATAGSALEDEMVQAAQLFLLRNKDRYGVWHSTQTTIQVLQSLVETVGPATSKSGSGTPTLALRLNGNALDTVALPPPGAVTGPIRIPVRSGLRQGTNRLTLEQSGSGTTVSAHLVTSFAVPWSGRNDGRMEGDSVKHLRLDVAYDRTRLAAGGTVTCKVQAERIGHRGYGMLLAEVGLPPGAEVDRESLDRASRDSGWAFSRYEGRPDRVILYLWPRAGGVEIEFSFRMRYGLRAKGAPSTLYDYYNPEAQVVVEPASFVVE